MVIGLVLWAVSVGLLIIAAVVAIRFNELSEKTSKCYVMEGNILKFLIHMLYRNCQHCILDIEYHHCTH